MTEINKKTHYPVDAKGNMLEEEPRCYWRGEKPIVNWKPMDTFTAELSFVRHEKGRSSLRLILMDVAEGVTYSLMESSMDEFISNASNGKLVGFFEVIKRGAYYGIILKEVL